MTVLTTLEIIFLWLSLSVILYKAMMCLHIQAKKELLDEHKREITPGEDKIIWSTMVVISIWGPVLIVWVSFCAVHNLINLLTN